MIVPLRARRPLALRLALRFAGATLILAGIPILAAYLYFLRAESRSVQAALSEYVQIAASTISGEDSRALTTAVQAIAGPGRDLRSAYTLSRGAGENIIAASDLGVTPGQTSKPGQIFPASRALKLQFNGLQSPLVELGKSTSEGDLYWVYAPLARAASTPRSLLAVQILDSVSPRYRQTTGLIALAFWAFLVLALGFLGWLSGRQVSSRLKVVLLGADQVASGDMNYRLSLESPDETGVLGRAFNAMVARVYEREIEAEQRLNLRNRQLQRLTSLQQAAAEIAQAAASQLDSEKLTQEVVDLIRERFDLYYAGLFLVDETREWAVLKSGTGPAGEAMLARGHRLPVGSGMIGWSIANAQARVAQDAGRDTVRLATAELPETRAEAALPLRSRGQVIGAISIQSRQPNAFEPESLTVLQSMADQVAAAIDNARLFRENQAALETVRQAYGELTSKAWNDLLQTRRVVGYARNSAGLTPLTRSDPDLSNSSNLPGTPGISLPLQVRGRKLGYIEATKPQGRGWSQEEQILLSALVEQLSVALESARLYQDSQRRAEREQLAGEITARLRASSDPATILQTAVTELRQALRAREAQVMFKPTNLDLEAQPQEEAK